MLFTEKGRYKSYSQVYSNAIYEACLQDVQELEQWLSGCKNGYFYDHERDKKGKLIRCKYTYDKRKADAARQASGMI